MFKLIRNFLFFTIYFILIISNLSKDYLEIRVQMHPIIIGSSDVLGYTLRIERVHSFPTKINNVKSQISERPKHSNNHFVFRYDVDNNLFNGDNRIDGIHDHLNVSYTVNYQSEANRSMLKQDKLGDEEEIGALDIKVINFFDFKRFFLQSIKLYLKK